MVSVYTLSGLTLVLCLLIGDVQGQSCPSVDRGNPRCFETPASDYTIERTCADCLRYPVCIMSFERSQFFQKSLISKHNL